jgi:hypothetical protein
LRIGLEFWMRNKRAILVILFSFLVSSFASVNAIAQPIIQEEVRLSKLTLSAFECAVLAGDSKEAHRLLEVGFTAGRSFLSGISNLTKAERAKMSGQIDQLWHQVWDGTSQSVVAKPPTDALGQSLWGPTTDFILGRVFSQRAAWVNAASGDPNIDEQTRNLKKVDMYRERKCSLTEFHRSEHSNPPTYYRSWHN